MGKNSRERIKAKRKAAEETRRKAAEQAKRKAAEEAQRRATAGPPPASPAASSPGPSAREGIDEIIRHAINAQHQEEWGQLQACRALLTVGPGGPAGAQLVNRALLTELLRVIEYSWRRGWQPAELVRMARRDSARHGRLVVDGIAAQMRGYPSSTVDQRWQSQLVDLDAQVWWEHDDHYLFAWGEQERLDREEAIAVVLEVLFLVATLPPIESVGPTPGNARSGGVTPPADLDQRMLDRVRALLAKAESTDFQEEADAFTAKAQELMARHRIDHALLVATTGTRDEPALRRISIDNPYEAPKSMLLQIVGQANSVRAVWTKRFGFSTLVGFPTDLDATELLFTSLLVQATRAMTQVKPGPDRYGRNTTRSFRQSFLAAYAARIGERLSTATEAVDREMTASAGAAQLLPVLAARDDAVRNAFEKQFPALSQHTTTITNREGWVSGRAAADQASLHGRRAVPSG